VVLARFAGRPHAVARRHGLRPEEILVVGDSLDSDVAMAERFGSPSLHLGVDAAAGPVPLRRRSPQPDFRLDSLVELFGLLNGDSATDSGVAIPGTELPAASLPVAEDRHNRAV
jgi:hypothetical protein